MTDNVSEFMADLEPNPDRAYHEHEGFNQSTANKLLNQSPRHAFEYRRWQKIRRGSEDPDHTREREVGTVSHKLVLGSHTGYQEVNADDWRTKEARASRSACERVGITPILSPDLEKASRAANALRDQLREEFGIEFDGQSEVELYWEQSVGGATGLRCKAKLDHIRKDGVTVLDIKTGDDANPKRLVRRILDQGYHVQAGCYLEGLGLSFPELRGRLTFLDVFIETSGLVLCTPTEIGGELLELGRREWLRACKVWDQCQNQGFYPGYVTSVFRPQCPPWALEQEMNHVQE